MQRRSDWRGRHTRTRFWRRRRIELDRGASPVLKCARCVAHRSFREQNMNRRLIACGLSIAVLFVVTGTARAQQPPNIGVAPVTLAESAYVFDTAEQHKIRVT